MDVELFSGAGGLSTGLAMRGIRVRGYEIELTYASTAIANGHDTVVGDVSKIVGLPTNIRLLSGGPPCQGFSVAGKGAGRHDVPLILKLATDMVMVPEYAGGIMDAGAKHLIDRRSRLVLEPLRWILAGDPRAVLLEQVSAILPFWEHMANLLTSLGYSTWAGILHAECYGVPQTRKRAVLLASKDVQVHAPVPTHSRYYTRSPDRLDPNVLRWVTMAEALGWGLDERPSYTVTGGGTAAGGAEPFGYAARQGMTSEIEAGRWVLRSQYSTNSDYTNRGERTLDQPAPTITSKAGRNKWVIPLRDAIKVTPAQAAILQSFPTDYIFEGNQGQQFQQIGNAMPPLLAHACAKVLFPASPS